MTENAEVREEKELTGPVRWALILGGTLSLGLAIIGIAIPILPTTPFLLLAAACFARSSKRVHHWMMTNRAFGSYLNNYRQGRGIPWSAKTFTLALLWTTMLISIVFFVEELWIQVLLLVIALAVSVHILTIKTYKGPR